MNSIWHEVIVEAISLINVCFEEKEVFTIMSM